MNIRQKLYLALGVLVLIVAGVLVYFYMPFGQASSLHAGAQKMSIFAYPGRIVANGKDQAKIMAVIKQKQNPVSGINVYFTTTVGNLSQNQIVTGDDGQAITYLSSGVAGEAVVTAVAGEMSKDIHVNISAQ